MSITQKQRTFTNEQLKLIALTHYLALFIYMPLWLLWLNPSNLPIALSLGLFTLPMLFPLSGLITGNPYTFAWSNFIIILYFLHSLTTLWVSPGDLMWASIELYLATGFFLSGTYYAKYKGQELGLSIRKKK